MSQCLCSLPSPLGMFWQTPIHPSGPRVSSASSLKPFLQPPLLLLPMHLVPACQAPCTVAYSVGYAPQDCSHGRTHRPRTHWAGIREDRHWPWSLPSEAHLHAVSICFVASAPSAGNKSSVSLRAAPSLAPVGPRPLPNARGGRMTQSDPSAVSPQLASTIGSGKSIQGDTYLGFHWTRREKPL